MECVPVVRHVGEMYPRDRAICRCMNKTALEVVLLALTLNDEEWWKEIREYSLKNSAFVEELLGEISNVPLEKFPEVQKALKAVLDA